MAVALTDVAPTEAELKSANYLNEISGPGFMHRHHLAPINALVQRILAAWNRRELESASQPGGDAPVSGAEWLSLANQAHALKAQRESSQPGGGEAIFKKVMEAIRLADNVGRSRQANNYAMNNGAIDKLVDLELEIAAMLRAAPSAWNGGAEGE